MTMTLGDNWPVDQGVVITPYDPYAYRVQQINEEVATLTKLLSKTWQMIKMDRQLTEEDKKELLEWFTIQREKEKIAAISALKNEIDLAARQIELIQSMDGVPNQSKLDKLNHDKSILQAMEQSDPMNTNFY